MRTTLRTLALGLALALYSAAFAEAFLRLLDPQALLPRYVTGSEVGVRANIPNAQYRHSTPEVEILYRINAQGMRDDRIFPAAKPHGTCRVALFGDSFFMGYELDLEDSFAFRLEAHLRDRGLRAEVLNFAVSGFGTAEMRRMLEARGLAFDPDLVVFQWHATDPEDNARAGLWRLGEQGLEPGRAAFLPGIAIQDRLMAWWPYRFLNDHSHLYAYLRERAAGAIKQISVELHAPAEDQGASTIRGASQGALALSAALLQSVRTRTEAEGRRFLVVEIPERASRTSFASTLARLPEASLAGIDWLTPVDAFTQAASPDRKLYFERGHGHLTPFAADLLASLVAERIEPGLRTRRCDGAPASRLAARP